MEELEVITKFTPANREDIARIEDTLARLEKKINALGVAALYLTGIQSASRHRFESDRQIEDAINSSVIVRDLKAAFYPELK